MVKNPEILKILIIDRKLPRAEVYADKIKDVGVEVLALGQLDEDFSTPVHVLVVSGEESINIGQLSDAYLRKLFTKLVLIHDSREPKYLFHDLPLSGMFSRASLNLNEFSQYIKSIG